MGVNVAELSDRGPSQKASARKALGLGESPVLLFLGRLTEKKGLLVLLQAAAELHRKNHHFNLVIAGEGELRATIEKQVRELNLDKQVRMPGFVTGQQKQAYLTAADVVVVPSIVTAAGDVEGLPVALLEGMAAGKICIASDVSGADDVIADGKDGFIVPAGDSASLSAALIRVLEFDPPAASMIGEHAAERAREFDWARIATAHYRHLFAELDSGPGFTTGD
jgi:glycosyltransferase involved in cell wall biosynthesis